MEMKEGKMVSSEEYAAFETWKKKSTDELGSLSLNVPVNVVEGVPETKAKELIFTSKLDVLSANIEVAREKLMRLNGPTKDREIDTISLNYRNFHRQLVYNRAKLMILDSGSELEENGRKVLKHDIEFAIDKLTCELRLLQKELDLFGLDKELVLHGEI